jgi:hypothetical protein
LITSYSREIDRQSKLYLIILNKPTQAEQKKSEQVHGYLKRNKTAAKEIQFMPIQKMMRT